MPENDLLRQRLQSALHTVNNHRLLVYSLASLAAVVGVVVNALKNYSNFYSVAIYLSKSSRSVLALANFCFLIALLCGHLVQRLFFGPLRPNEVERLYDRLWFFITESLLAFTIFRDEFDTSFGVMFGFLLFVKSFHWLASDRIEWMDQRPYPGPPLLFHVRMIVLIAILWTINCIMFIFTVDHTLTVGVGIGGMVLFASEYGILIASVTNTFSKYLLSAYELRRAGQRGGENAPPWENKSMWTFYIELVTDFMKLTVYLAFFAIILTFYGLPLNIVRDVYITARSFITRLRALHRYQTATRNMDQRYSNASEEELTAMSDRTCIICREEMVFQGVRREGAGTEGPNMTPKKLPCGHIFHFYCLRSWLERQQSCPTCRRTVFDDNNTTQQANPAPPAAGAVPQGVNPAFDNRNLQGVNNNQLNPAELANRIFGQANAPLHANAQPVPVPGLEGVRVHPPAMLIQYEVQYQGRRPQGNDPGQSPQNLTPVPQFPGHMAPNGAWQPWPPAEHREEQPTANTNVEAATASSQGSQNQSQQSSETSAEVSAVPAADGAPADTVQDGSEAPPDSPRLSPREAAREAALRRFNNASGGSSSPAIPTPTRTTPTPTPVPQSATPSPISASTSADSQPVRRTDVPSLIPLYGLVFSPDPNEQATMIRYPGVPTPQYGPHSAGIQLPPALEQSSSLGSIPSHVSEEQLSTLDQITREAIDERLRVLEGVSNTVYRCIDDLMRVRSALPATPSAQSVPQFVSGQGTPNSVQAQASTSTSSTSTGQEKIPELSFPPQVADQSARGPEQAQEPQQE